MTAARPSGKKFLNVLEGDPASTPPIWMMRQAGRYLPEYRKLRSEAKSFLDFCYRPELALEATLQPLRRYAFDAAILFSDILVVPDGLGQAVRFQEGEGPLLDPIRDRAGIDALDLERMTLHLRPVYDAVARIKAAIADDVALIGFAGAPWTVAVYMIEGRGRTDCSTIGNFATAARADFQALIDLLVEATIRHLDSQIRHGAEAVQIFDSWSGLLDDPGFERWSIEPTRAIVAALKKKHPTVPIIGFPRGAGAKAADYAAGTGVAGIGIDEEIDIAWAAEALQPSAAVQGNLSNRLLVEGGRPMESAVVRILETLGRGRFIFNLGHGILPETPPENVGRVVDMVKSWKAAP